MDNVQPFGNIEDVCIAMNLYQPKHLTNLFQPNTLDLAFNFGDDNGALENFDFDSFLHTDDGGAGGFGLGGEFDFGNPVEAGAGDL